MNNKTSKTGKEMAELLIVWFGFLLIWAWVCNYFNIAVYPSLYGFIFLSIPVLGLYSWFQDKR